MSRPGPALSSLTFAQLQPLINANNESVDDRTPKDWFERAVRESELSVLAARKQRKEEMFLCYTKACQYYTNARMHPDFGAVKKSDPNWGARVKDFKETYEAYLAKSKELKEALKKRDIEREGAPSPTPSSSSSAVTPGAAGAKTSGPETTSMGSIADRMKALSGKGMDVGDSNRRMSKDLGNMAPPPVSAGLTRNGGIHATGGAGNYGPARTGATRPRSSSRTEEKESGHHGLEIKTSSVETKTRSRSSSIKESKPPVSASSASKVNLPPHDEQPATATATTSPSTSSHRPPPITAPKPKLPMPPSSTPTQSIQESQPHAGQSAIPPSNTGSSSSSTRANIGETGSRTETPTTTSFAPSHSGPAPQSAKSSKPPLPPIPQNQAHQPEPSQPGPGPGPETANGLLDFERTFPSLDDFGKQFPEPPAPPPNGTAAEEGRYAFPDVPSSSFPDLPSVPKSRPGLPTPPNGSPPGRFGSLKPVDQSDNRHDSPPNPDADRDTKRPSSQPNLTKLDGRIDPSISNPNSNSMSPEHTAPTLQDFRTPQPPSTVPGSVPTPIMSPQSTMSPPNGYGHDSSPIAFPTPQPTPPQRRSMPIPGPDSSKSMKPKFPFSNSINCETLRSYFLNPDVEMVLLDVRPEEEYRRGVVGAEYEPRGAKLRVVWMDPTVLMRNDITSAKLEDSLSLSTEKQRQAFADRHKADLVVVYDSRSSSWPQGSQPTPLSRLWNTIYEHEFAKRLERTPVLLEGGFAAWREFIKMRVAKHTANGHLPRTSSKPVQGQTNGYAPSPLSPPPPGGRERSGSGESSKRANRDAPVYQASSYARNITDNVGRLGHSHAQSMAASYQTNHAPSRSYVSSPPGPGPSSNHRPSNSLSAYNSPAIAPPPQASIHPGPGPRRQSDYVEHHNQSYSGYMPPPSSSSRPPVANSGRGMGHSHAHPQPPPPTAAHALERYDSRPPVPRSTSIRELALVANGEEVRYWGDVMLGLTGLKNFGSTCYMNSTVQCLSATYPFSQFFLDGSFKRAINVRNKLGTKGDLANAWSELLKALWREDYTFLSPVTFRTSIVRFASQFSATNEQHDSQEFLSFVLDGLHEDLNRVQVPPAPVEMTPERELALETLPPEVAAEKEWQIYKQRNDSFIVDLFQGQYRNRLECLTCRKTSTTYDTFMYISLPITAGKNKVVIQELIDDFIASEIMDGDDKWNCPRCKVPRRATKTLTIARLPPIVIIQLKRFTTKDGVFWNKSENHVIFPMQGLDLTRYVPHRQQRGNEDMNDPRTQIGPFRYDLYGVSNHIGTLSSGHYTAFVKDAKGWTYAEDSRISKAQEKDIVSRQAYMLFYKRVR